MNADFSLSIKYTVFVFTGPLTHWYSSIVQFIGSCLSDGPGSWPIIHINTAFATEATWEKLPFELLLLLSAIALTAADFLSTQTLQVVVHRVTATAQVAAIVAEWEGRRVLLNHTFMFWRY